MENGTVLNGGGKLTAKTDARASVKRDIAPANRCEVGTLPSLGAIVVGIVTVEVFPSVQVVGEEIDADLTAHEDGISTVWATAAGQPGGSLGDAHVYGDGRIKAKGY